jgi:hypothetical protein
MKTFLLFVFTLTIVLMNQTFAQEQTQPGWEIMPGVVIVNYFPSSSIKTSPWEEYRFDGSGLQFIVRAFRQEYPNVAFTFSGGMNWFENVQHSYPVVAMEANSGVGAVQKYNSFKTFPLMVGAEWVYPRSIEHKLIFYAGANAGLHFIDGDLDMNQQAKLGYTLESGFIVKVFEFGVRYISFSDLRNLGVHLGLRFNSFSVE